MASGAVWCGLFLDGSGFVVDMFEDAVIGYVCGFVVVFPDFLKGVIQYDAVDVQNSVAPDSVIVEDLPYEVCHLDQVPLEAILKADGFAVCGVGRVVAARAGDELWQRC